MTDPGEESALHVAARGVPETPVTSPVFEAWSTAAQRHGVSGRSLKMESRYREPDIAKRMNDGMEYAVLCSTMQLNSVWEVLISTISKPPTPPVRGHLASTLSWREVYTQMQIRSLMIASRTLVPTYFLFVAFPLLAPLAFALDGSSAAAAGDSFVSFLSASSSSSSPPCPNSFTRV